MAWLVALSGGPVRAARPRVTTVEGPGVRPISMTNYLGLPVYARDRLAGVVEVAGDIANVPKSSIKQATGRLQSFDIRLVHDPAMRPPQLLTADTECSLCGGMPNGETNHLSVGEWSFVSAIQHEDSIGDLSRRLNLDLGEMMSLAQQLIERGAIQARVPTQMLSISAAPEFQP